MKICLLVPSTTNGLEITDITDTHLYKILIKSLSKDKPKKHKITIYIGYDSDDKIYSIYEQRLKLQALVDKVNIIWLEQNEEKGYVTKIWNNLAEQAIKDNFEYMYVCGDDIEIDNNKWMTDWIPKLKENNNIGWVAGFSHNDRIPTQFLIHKTHYEIFGYIYPKQLRNYFCDDFMYELYPDKYRIWLKEYRHLNIGGEPRYKPCNDRNLCSILVKKYKKILKSYLDKQEFVIVQKEDY